MNKPAIVKEAFTPEAAPPKVARFNEPYSPTSTGASNGAINARIDPKITTALLRASVDRRIGGQMPFTHRDIIAEALSAWLKKNGYLN